MQKHICIVALLALCVALTSAIPHEGKKVEYQPNTMGCLLCEFVTTELFDWMAENTTAPEVESFLDKICMKMSFPASYECEWLAKELVKIIPMLVYHIPRQNIIPLDVCGIIKKCDVDCCSSALPEQLRLSVESNNEVMFVSWVQSGNWTNSVVQYGLNGVGGPLTQQTVAHAHTYSSGNWKGYIYNATLIGLKQNAKYWYRVGSDAGGWSKVNSFRTFVNSGYEATTTTWAVIGDMGANSESDNTVARLKELAANDAVGGLIHLGDFYADGIQRIFDLFGRKVEDISANIPYQVVPGNHELAFVTYLGLDGFKNRWFMPYSAPLVELPGGQEPYWYTFTRGPIRFIGLNSESHLDVALITPVQLAWLKQTLDLAQQTRQQHPWIVVGFHRPLYCSSSRVRECETFGGWLQKWLEPIFMQYKVDIVFAGHMHNYERTYPLYKGVAQPGYTNATAPVYIINGAGGNREGFSGFTEQAPAWSAIRLKEIGYGLMSATMNSLTWKFYSSSDNSLQDTMVLSK